jgi:hypothetical protein
MVKSQKNKPKSKPKTSNQQASPQKTAKGAAPVLPHRGPWKRSWKVLWGFLSAIGELVLIFLVRSQLVELGNVQIIVLAVCIPIAAHLLISGLRQFLILISPR